MKVALRFATIESGGQCATMAGIIGMQLLYAYSWDFREQVPLTCSICMEHYYNHIMALNATIDATALRGSYFGDGTGPFHLSGVGCSGEERTLFQCSYYGSIIGYHTCGSGHDAGVRCDGMYNYFPIYIIIIICIAIYVYSSVEALHLL